MTVAGVGVLLMTPLVLAIELRREDCGACLAAGYREYDHLEVFRRRQARAGVFGQVVGFPGSVRGSGQTVHRHSGERL